MKKIFTIISLVVLCGLGVPVMSQAATKTTTTAKTVAVKKTVKKTPITLESLLGHFVIQKESYNRLWYISPQNKKRYILQNDEDIKKITTDFSVDAGSDFAKIVGKAKNAPYKKYAGKIIFHGTSKKWYVNPDDLKLYAINTFTQTYATMKIIGKSITDEDLRKAAMNTEQMTFDSAFPSVAYVKYDGIHFANGYNNKTILPLASLSKVMTALVFLDQNVDWDKQVTITQEEIDYPKKLVGDDGTSEVSLRAGDEVKVSDLWIAMLSASSNQSAVVLADNSGLSRKEFVEQMNKKATSFGLTKTVFHEFTGLDYNNISTPEEMAIIGQHAFTNDKIVAATNVVDYAFVVQNQGQSRNVSVKNRNYSLLAFNPEASKTGFLVEAQRNVVLKKNDQIIVVLHAGSMAQRNEIIKKLLANTTLSYNK